MYKITHKETHSHTQVDDRDVEAALAMKSLVGLARAAHDTAYEKVAGGAALAGGVEPTTSGMRW